MKSIIRIVHGCAIAIVLAGFASILHPATFGQTRLLEAKAAQEEMPIPVCLPNDPNACGIDKW